MMYNNKEDNLFKGYNNYNRWQICLVIEFLNVQKSSMELEGLVNLQLYLDINIIFLVIENKQIKIQRECGRFE